MKSKAEQLIGLMQEGKIELEWRGYGGGAEEAFYKRYDSKFSALVTDADGYWEVIFQFFQDGKQVANLSKKVMNKSSGKKLIQRLANKEITDHGWYPNNLIALKKKYGLKVKTLFGK